jgi:small subunit ribosomal protein S12
MTTYNQFVSGARFSKKYYKWKRRALAISPQKAGKCKVVSKISPKKPCSAKRAVALVKLRSGILAYCYIPGIGHPLRARVLVLICGGRRNDLPGVKYKIIRAGHTKSKKIRRFEGTLITQSGHPERISSRSVYGFVKRETDDERLIRVERRGILIQRRKTLKKVPTNAFFCYRAIRTRDRRVTVPISPIIFRKQLQKSANYLKYLNHPGVFLKKCLFYDYFQWLDENKEKS